MILPRFEYKKPNEIQEAARLYQDYEGKAVYLSGGTDLIPRLKLRLERPKAVIDLKCIDPLGSVDEEEKWIRIGSLVSLFDLKQNSLIREFFPSLVESLEATSCETLQMRGTIGGNLLQNCRCLFYNQSEFWRTSKGLCLKMGGEKCNAVPGAKRCFANYCSDNAPALCSLSAEVELFGPEGTRRITLEEIYSNKSGRPFNLNPGEILTSIFLPKKKSSGGYEKLRLRGSIDYPLVGVAFSLVDGAGKMAVGAIGAKPSVAEIADPSQEAIQRGIEAISSQVNPVNNTVVDSDFRKRMIPILAKRLVNRVMEGAV